MAGKEESITFAKSFFSPPGMRKRYGDVFPKLIDSGSLKVSIDVSFPVPGAGVDLKKLKRRGDSSLSKFNQLFDKQFDTIFPDVAQCYQLDQQNDAKAYSKASKSVKELNDYIEEMLETLRVELRKGVAGELGVDPRNLSTIGTEDFRKFNLVRGVFNGDDPTAADGEKNVKLIKALKSGKGKWYFCGMAAHGTMAYLVLDRKKPIQTSTLKELKDEVGGSAVIMEGICCPKGTNLDIRLLKNSSKKPKKVHVKEGLKAQTGMTVKVMAVKLDLDKIPSNSELAKLDASGNPKGGDGGEEKGKK